MNSNDVIRIVSVIVISILSFISIVFCYCRSCAYRNRQN